MVPLYQQHLAVCFIQKGIKFTKGLKRMTWFLLVLWFDITHRQTHTGHTRTNRQTHTYKYMTTPPVFCTLQLTILYGKNYLLIQKFTLQRSTMSLLSKNYSLVKVIHLLIRFNKSRSFLWNTKNTDRNGINEQNTHTTHREKDNQRKS